MKQRSKVSYLYFRRLTLAAIASELVGNWIRVTQHVVVAVILGEKDYLFNKYLFYAHDIPGMSLILVLMYLIIKNPVI